MLTLLGTVSGSKRAAVGGSTRANGVDEENQHTSYDLFIRALAESNFTDVVKELRRTERKTKFGDYICHHLLIHSI